MNQEENSKRPHRPGADFKGDLTDWGGGSRSKHRNPKKDFNNNLIAEDEEKQQEELINRLTTIIDRMLKKLDRIENNLNKKDKKRGLEP